MNHGAIAARLLDSYDRASLTSLPSVSDAGFSMSDAYAIAEINRQQRMARGERALGYKIGFTNRGIWDRYDVHEPIWGPVWDTTVRELDGTRAVTDLAGLSQPRLEPEIMFGFRASPKRGMNERDLVDCIEWVAHGFEIVHTHFEAWRFAAADTAADFALHGRLFIGPKVDIAAFPDPAEELAAVQVKLYSGDKLVETGVASIVLDGPMTALRIWLDAMLAQPHGWHLKPGDVVTTGTITDAWPLAPGQRWRTELSDSRLAGLEFVVEA